MNKIAKVTLSFWLIKICATTLGETAGFGTIGASAILGTLMVVLVYLANQKEKRSAPNP